jgi:hypothetical protein
VGPERIAAKVAGVVLHAQDRPADPRLRAQAGGHALAERRSQLDHQVERRADEQLPEELAMGREPGPAVVGVELAEQLEALAREAREPTVSSGGSWHFQ